MSAALDQSAHSLASFAIALRSPLSRAPLVAVGHALLGGGERWPVVDDIAYLRADKPAAVAGALVALDAGDADEAAAVLLAADAGGPPLAEARALVAARDALGFREAMRALGFGARVEREAHRWSDPAHLASLALLEAHWTARARVLHAGCGPGQVLRALARAAGPVVGADGRFADLWLARHWVAPMADLICLDPVGVWPVADAAADMVLCGDAAGAEAARVAGPRGTVLRAGCDAALAGAGRLVAYDDAELVAALLGRRAPRARTPAALAGAASVSVVTGAGAARPPAPVLGRFEAPRGTPLRRNPLYADLDDGSCARRFPSEAYAEAVGARATYPVHVTARARVIAGADPADDALIRRRVWVDLPPRW